MDHRDDTNLIGMIRQSIVRNWEKPAFSDYAAGARPVRYSDLALRVGAIHAIFRELGLGAENDTKIAVIGKNSTNWATAYLATILYGAVVVPILPDFNPEEIRHIIHQSDSVVLFCADDIYKTLPDAPAEQVRLIISLNDFRVLFQNSASANLTDSRAIASLTHGDAPCRDDYFQTYAGQTAQSDEALVSIVYTSGTTGFSKGVMLPQRSLKANILFSQENMPLASGDTILSFLPLAHAFGCAFEFLFPVSKGCHITFLDKTPSPTILLKAFAQIKPRLVLSVPLIIEKLYTNNVKKLIQGKLAFYIKLPLVNRLVKATIRKKLTQVFGGRFIEIIVGGAALNPEVEHFLRDIKFKYTIGYGMTECGPLISYAPWHGFRKNSVGKVVDTLELRIDSADPLTIPGEILVSGANVMHGYYKNDAETANAFTPDGWFKTGDLGVVDRFGNISIRGRKKTMLLGPSGQNIYPEEIEARLNNLPLVKESLVVQRNNKLTALVFPEPAEVAEKGLGDAELAKLMEMNRKTLNAAVSSHCAISKIQIVEEEFAKTPSKKIKRFLYS